VGHFITSITDARCYEKFSISLFFTRTREDTLTIQIVQKIFMVINVIIRRRQTYFGLEFEAVLYTLGLKFMLL